MAVGDHDRAISMYKNSLQYDHMIRLVQQHHKELLNETHLHLAQVHLVWGVYVLYMHRHRPHDMPAQEDRIFLIYVWIVYTYVANRSSSTVSMVCI